MAILAIIVVGLKGYYYSRLFLATYFSLFYANYYLPFDFCPILTQPNGQRKMAAKFYHFRYPYYYRGTIEFSSCPTRIRLATCGNGRFRILMVKTFATFRTLYVAMRLVKVYAVQRYAMEHGMRFRFLPEMGANYAGELFLESLEGIPLFSERKSPYLIGRTKA